MKTIDISGFGGGYEDCCQAMLQRGIRFLKNRPAFDWSGYTQYQNITGVAFANNKDAKELDEVVTKDIGPTGAQRQAVINHLYYIHAKGYAAWLATAKANGRKITETLSLEELEKRIMVAQAEWQAKLDSGYNPLENLLENVPPENIITYDPKHPEEAAERIAEIIEGDKDD